MSPPHYYSINSSKGHQAGSGTYRHKICAENSCSSIPIKANFKYNYAVKFMTNKSYYKNEKGS